MKEKKKNKNENQGMELLEVSAVTPHNRALYEAGKMLLTDSITTGRDFCKFMISLSTGAIPIYLGLLKFVLPEHYTLSLQQGVLAIIPVVLFLIASIVFTIGYYPQVSQFSLDVIDEIEKERTRTIFRRKKLSLIGFSIFLIGTVNAIVTIIVTL